MMDPINTRGRSIVSGVPSETKPSAVNDKGLTGRLRDLAIFQNLKDVAEDVSSAGTQWLSNPIQSLRQIVSRISIFFGLGMLSVFARHQEREREDRKSEDLKLLFEEQQKQRRQAEARRYER